MRSNSRFLNRRNFLRGAAGVAVGLPLLESIGSGPLQAQTLAPVKRFLSFHSSNGVNDTRFWPTVTNGALSASHFAGRATEPLVPFIDKLLVPRGVHGYPSGTWTGHIEGTCQALTAATYNSQNLLAQGISIDQVIANALNPPGREALVMRPGPGEYNQVYNSISYRGPEQQAPAESNPYRAYRAMMGVGMGPVPDDDEAYERLVRRRQSVIDLAREEFEELRRIELSKADRDKLEQHFSLIRDVESGMTGDPAVACTLTATTAAELEAINGETVEANDNFPTMARYFVQLAALSLACQYTRSAVLMWGGAVVGAPMYRWDGMNHTYRHHPLSHGTTGDFNESAVVGYQDMLFDIDRWSMGEFAKLLALLDSYDEGEGRTLLDNTVVLYTNEFSHGGGHTTGNLPILIAGGAGHFQMGRAVLLNGSHTNNNGVSGANGNSNRLLCTVLNAVGVPTTSFQNGTRLTELEA